jgi:hypothetical protein
MEATEFFTLIGQALLRALRQKSINRPPVGLVANIQSWARPNPTFSVWPCNGNPRGEWGTRRGPSSLSPLAAIKLRYIDIVGSDTDPPSLYGREHPQRYIHGTYTLFQRYFAPEQCLFTQGLSLTPQQGLAHIWSRLVATPNVALEAEYELRDGGASTLFCLTFLTRFTPNAHLDLFMDVNPHLLQVSPPLTWGMLPINLTQVSVIKPPSPPSPLPALVEVASIAHAQHSYKTRTSTNSLPASGVRRRPRGLYNSDEYLPRNKR